MNEETLGLNIALNVPADAKIICTSVSIEQTGETLRRAHAEFEVTEGLPESGKTYLLIEVSE